MSEIMILIIKNLTIHRLTACPIPINYITSLNTKPWHDPMECASFKMKRFSLLTCSQFPSAQTQEVIGGPSHLEVEKDVDGTKSLSINFDVQENWWEFFLGHKFSFTS